MKNLFKGKNLVAFFILVGVEILLVLTVLLGWSTGIRRMISLYSDPLVYWAGSSAKSVNDFFYTATEFGSLRERYNRVLIENAELKAENSKVHILQKEVEALEKMKIYESEDVKFLRAAVVNKELYFNKAYFYLNKGADDGIEVGMPVLFGDIFVGFVDTVEKGSSKIRLPYSKESNIYVNIYDSKGNFAEGVVSGSNSSLELNNVPANFDLKTGQEIIVTDERVGLNVVLGAVSEVDGDVTDAVKGGEVAPIVNYRNIKYVFIKL